MASATVEARRAAIAQILAGLLLFVALDRSIFGSGFYLNWASPDSGVGRLHYVVKSNAEKATKADKFVLVFGDSRLAEGFSARAATAEAVRLGSRVEFLNSGVPGTTPRVWRYMLRAYRDLGLRPAAVLYMATSYRADTKSHQPDFPLDLAHVHPFLGVRDAIFFASSFHDPELSKAAFSAALFKGWPYHADFMDLLAHPLERMNSVEVWRSEGAELLDSYESHEDSLAGLTLDPASGAIGWPTGAQNLPPGIKAYVARLLKSRNGADESEVTLDYDRLWYGAAADLAREMGAKLIVFRIPAGPLDGQIDPRPKAGGALAELAAAGALSLVPADAFDELEAPEFFFDEAHLNRAGRAQFTPRLVRQTLPLLER